MRQGVRTGGRKEARRGWRPVRWHPQWSSTNSSGFVRETEADRDLSVASHPWRHADNWLPRVSYRYIGETRLPCLLVTEHGCPQRIKRQHRSVQALKAPCLHHESSTGKRMLLSVPRPGSYHNLNVTKHEMTLCDSRSLWHTYRKLAFCSSPYFKSTNRKGNLNLILAGQFLTPKVKTDLSTFPSNSLSAQSDGGAQYTQRC